MSTSQPATPFTVVDHFYRAVGVAYTLESATAWCLANESEAVSYRVVTSADPFIR